MNKAVMKDAEGNEVGVLTQNDPGRVGFKFNLLNKWFNGYKNDGDPAFILKVNTGTTYLKPDGTEGPSMRVVGKAWIVDGECKVQLFGVGKYSGTIMDQQQQQLPANAAGPAW